MRGAISDYVSYFTSSEKAGCLDHGYYGEGQQWSVSAAHGQQVVGQWTPMAYGAWLSGVDPVTGEKRGRALHEGEQRVAVRAYEYGVNVPKSASVVAWLHPDLAAALAAAQERAAVTGVQAVRRGAKARLTELGVTRYVDVDEVEVAVFGHDGSREGDPHAHLHVQIGSKVFVEGKWRALAGRTMVRALDDWKVTVSASLATDPGWIQACAGFGFTVGPDGGIVEIPREVEKIFSKRDAAIVPEEERRIARFIAETGHAPGAEARADIHQQAWSVTRPKKGDKPLLSPADVEHDLREAGFGWIADRVAARRGTDVQAFDRSDAHHAALLAATTREVLSERDLRLVAAAGIAAAGGTCADLEPEIAVAVSALRAQCIAAQLPTGEDVWVPSAVMASADKVAERLTRIRERAVVQGRGLRKLDTTGLTPGQVIVAEAIAGGMPVVVEGPAGTGKTHALRAALTARNAAGLATFAVAPSRTAVDQLGDGWTGADTAHGVLTKAGWTSVDGRWQRPESPEATDRMKDAVIIVDEAGMFDLHTMAAFLEYAEGQGARVALVGDERQLSPVGVGGGFAMAKSGSDVVALTEARRFADPQFAALATDWRSSDDVAAVAAAVMASGMVQIHATEDEAHVALAQVAAQGRDRIVMVSDNATAVRVNRLARAEHEARGDVARAVRGVGRFEEEIGVGDLVQTRLNDRHAGLVNRQRWVVTAVGEDKSLTVRRADRPAGSPQAITKVLPADYVAQHVHRADVVTVHAAQGATSGRGDALIDASWTREQAYVAITRGKQQNVVHVVAENEDEARATLLRVLRSSDRGRAAALVAITNERHHEAQTDLVPGIAARIMPATRSVAGRVGAWGATSTLTLAPPAEPPVAGQQPEAPSL